MNAKRLRICLIAHKRGQFDMLALRFSIGGFFMNKLSKIAGFALVLAFLGASPVIAKNPNNQGKSEGQKNSKGNSQKADSKNKDNHDNHHEMHYAGIDRSKTRQYAKQYNASKKLIGLANIKAIQLFHRFSFDQLPLPPFFCNIMHICS